MLHMGLGTLIQSQGKSKRQHGLRRMTSNRTGRESESGGWSDGVYFSWKSIISLSERKDWIWVECTFSPGFTFVWAGLSRETTIWTCLSIARRSHWNTDERAFDSNTHLCAHWKRSWFIFWGLLQYCMAVNTVPPTGLIVTPKHVAQSVGRIHCRLRRTSTSFVATPGRGDGIELEVIRPSL